MTERNNAEIRRTCWFLGCWNPENFNLVKVEVAENNLFSSTCWRFLYD
jgi:hypothetical protein